MKCEICEKEFEKLRGLALHINKIHKSEITVEEYYIKYIGDKGKCKECGKDTTLMNLKKGYQRFCGHKCSSKNIEVQNKKKETNLKNSGYEYPGQNPETIEKIQESTLKNNNGIDPRKLTFQKLKERYPLLVKVEELKEGPNGEILAHCKNSNCKNSKENGGYFEPTVYQLNWRKQGIDGNDTHYLYCCEECKKACPLYRKTPSRIHNLLNENPNKLYTREEYSTWRIEVFARQLRETSEHTINYCEYCHTTEDLRVHHIQPQKLEPKFVLDPDNGLVVCEKCHYEKCHKKGTECSSGKLANKICK